MWSWLILESLTDFCALADCAMPNAHTHPHMHTHAHKHAHKHAHACPLDSAVRTRSSQRLDSWTTARVSTARQYQYTNQPLMQTRHACAHASTCTSMQTHGCTIWCVRTCLRTQDVGAHIHVYTQVDTYVYTHVHRHIYTHVYAQDVGTEALIVKTNHAMADNAEAH